MPKKTTSAPVSQDDDAPLTSQAAQAAVVEAERCVEELKAKVAAANVEEDSARKAALQEQTMRESVQRRPTVTILDDAGGPNPTGVGLLQGAEMMQGVDNTPQPSRAALDRWTQAVSRRQSLEALLTAAQYDLLSARHILTHAEV